MPDGRARINRRDVGERFRPLFVRQLADGSGISALDAFIDRLRGRFFRGRSERTDDSVDVPLKRFREWLVAQATGTRNWLLQQVQSTNGAAPATAKSEISAVAFGDPSGDISHVPADATLRLYRLQDHLDA